MITKEYQQALQTRRLLAFFVPNHENQSARIVARILTFAPDAILLGGDGWGDTGELLFKLVGKRVFRGYSYTHWSSALHSSLSKEFTERFVQKMGYQPVDSSALMYDAVMLLLSSLEYVKIPDREHVRAYLSNLRNWSGVTGAITTDQRVETNKRPLLQMAQNGVFVLLDQQP